MSDDENNERGPGGPGGNNQVPAVMAAPVAIKLPAFWASNTKMWFIQAESQFALRKITEESTKFHHVISALDCDTGTQVMDVLENPGDTPYTTLKARLTGVYTLKDREKAGKILDMDSMGDKTPSQMLTVMLNLVLEAEEPGFLFREVFLRLLPKAVQAHLNSFKGTGTKRGDLRELAEEADRHFTSTGAMISAVMARDEEYTVDAVSGRRTSGRGAAAGRGRATSGRGGLRNGGRVDGRDLCFFHFRFRADARRCETPCQWVGPDARPGNSNPGRGASQ